MSVQVVWMFIDTHKTTSTGTERRDQFGESVELGLQRGDFTIASERHHQSTVERGGTDGNDDVFSDTFGDFGAGQQETILLCLFARLEVVSLGDTVFVGVLFDQVGFTSGTGFVALDIVAAQKDTVNRNNLSGFKNADVTDDNVLGKGSARARMLCRGTNLGVDDKFFATTNNITSSVVLFLIEFLELQFLLIIVDGSDHDDQCDSNEDSDTLNPFDLGFGTTFRGTSGTGVSVGFNTDRMIDTESERYDGGDTQDDLKGG